jgi:hypothetical protein
MEPRKGYTVSKTKGRWSAVRLRDGKVLGPFKTEQLLTDALDEADTAWQALVQAAADAGAQPVGPLISAQTDREPPQEPDGTRVNA